MDGTRFDGLTRALATSRSRRGVLGLLGASVATALTGASVAAKPKVGKPSKSKCYGDGSHCTNGKQCCSGICTNRQCAPEIGPEPECVTAATCPGEDTPCASRTCAGGECGSAFAAAGTGCPAGVCDGNGACVECLTGGECASGVCAGNVCEPGAICISDPSFGAPCTSGAGACQRSGVLVCAADGVSLECDAVPGPPSIEICNGIDDDCDGLVDEEAFCPDVANAFGGCVGGSCAYTCNEGFADCNADLTTDGCETNVSFDNANCGACGVICPLVGTVVGDILGDLCYGGQCACFAADDCPSGQGCFNASSPNPGFCHPV